MSSVLVSRHDCQAHNAGPQDLVDNPQPWVRVEDEDAGAEPLADFHFYAVLGTWNEEDIVEACVRNAFHQGCEQVFVVDNASDDATVERALGAGAVLAHHYATEGYDETLRIHHMQRVVDSVSSESGYGHIWWLWLDADEFSHGRSGLTIRQQLQSLDRRFRVVGARYLNHYPAGAPQYVRGGDPLDYQPLAEEIVYRHCDLAHRKHPLQRWDADGPRVTCGVGFHTATAPEQLVEPRAAVISHHFPFRDEAFTRARLEKLCASDDRTPRAPVDHISTGHIWPRYQSLDAVYRQEWTEVTNFITGTKGVHVRPWTELAGQRGLVDELEGSVVKLRKDLTDREFQVRALTADLALARQENERFRQSVTVQVLGRLSDRFYRAVGRHSLVARTIQASLRLIGRAVLNRSPRGS